MLPASTQLPAALLLVLGCACTPARHVRCAKLPYTAVLLRQLVPAAAAGRLLELLHVLLRLLPAHRRTAH
jgi:hypothetical protein